MTSSRTLEITKQDNVTVVSLGPEYESLDENRLDHLREHILNAAQTADPPLMAIDLSHTKFFGSAFIEILFRAWNQLSSRKGAKFCISGLTPYCAEVIEVTHLDRLWTIAKTREEAVQSLQAQ